MSYHPKEITKIPRKIQLNNMVWEKATTHNEKKKRSQRKTDPKALKKAKDARPTSSLFAYVSMIDVHGAMQSYNSTICGSWNTTKVVDSWSAHAGIKSMKAMWYGYANWEPGCPGDYLVEIRDEKRFLQACIKWGWDPKWLQIV